MNILKSEEHSTKVAQYKLRRLAQRALRVLDRHVAKSASMQVFRHTLVPAATEFMESYDAAMLRGPELDREVGEGRGAIVSLRTSFASWHGHLVRDIAGFSATSYRLGSRNPDDILSDAERLVTLVREVSADGQPLTYADALTADIEPKLITARSEWVQAQDALASRQEMAAKNRALAASVQRELVAFRSVLRTVIGASHRDYQKIRLGRAAAPDPDDKQAGGTEDAANNTEANVA